MDDTDVVNSGGGIAPATAKSDRLAAERLRKKRHRAEVTTEERAARQQRSENLMRSRVTGWYELGENGKVVRIMDRVCCDEAVAREVESLWKKCFVADAPILHQT